MFISPWMHNNLRMNGDGKRKWRREWRGRMMGQSQSERRSQKEEEKHPSIQWVLAPFLGEKKKISALNASSYARMTHWAIDWLTDWMNEWLRSGSSPSFMHLKLHVIICNCFKSFPRNIVHGTMPLFNNCCFYILLCQKDPSFQFSPLWLWFFNEPSWIFYGFPGKTAIKRR